jgi:hypothetical protein
MKNSIIILTLLTIFCSCDNSSLEELGQGYFLTHNSMNDRAIAKPINEHSTSEAFEIIIYGDIVSFDFDSQYLIAAERPRDSVPQIRNLPYNDAQRIFTRSNFRQYYILDKEKGKLYGPYTQTKFQAKRKELHVSAKLAINSNSR